MSLDDDARAFGQHFNQGGWRLGLLVARNVHMSEDERGRSDIVARKLGKLTANQFAEKAGVSARTVQLHYRAWELAARDGRCTPARDLSPGAEDPNINLEEDYEDERDEWLAYYRKVRPEAEPSPEPQLSAAGESTSRTRTPQARLNVAVKSVKGIDLATATDLPGLAQQLQDARKLLCELIDGLIEEISVTSTVEPERLDVSLPATAVEEDAA